MLVVLKEKEFRDYEAYKNGMKTAIKERDDILSEIRKAVSDNPKCKGCTSDVDCPECDQSPWLVNGGIANAVVERIATKYIYNDI